MRWIGLDCHLDFIEVAIATEDEGVRSAGRIETSAEQVKLFAESLGSGDVVALESTSNALQIANLIRPHVARVIIADARRIPQISQARAKTDRLDAITLATLARAGALEEVWAPDERTRVRRRMCSRRASLVRARTRAKNECHAVIARNLKGRPEATDMFGIKGREWLAAQELAADERLTADACVRLVDFLNAEIKAIDELVAKDLAHDEDARRLLTIPGVGTQATLALLASIGDVSRFEGPGSLVSYLGLDPRVWQSGSGEARHGRISKQGPSQTRAALVEAAQSAMLSPGPLRAFGERIKGRRGYGIAAVAVARKIACLAWHLLTKGEDYAFGRPMLTHQKIRRLELGAGAAPRRGRAGPVPTRDPARRRAERAAAEQAERSYERMVADWRSSGPGRRAKEKAAGLSRGRASKAARQESAPEPAL